ncbi:hypothetical protein KIW84_034683 [Lathyrus oleraceus]|uniref:Retrovirus-related Pol polyprotein from transposon TNT 1-94-like beta-barrel domain-containing protein n=2 Tax=Pisum sativum TaxID=3888 RepID=A0A9D4XZ30_PEA|nr:hypothetical protein KIW84_034683 [Pisum sativum]
MVTNNNLNLKAQFCLLGTLTREEGQKKFLGVITASANGVHVKLVGSSKTNLLTRRKSGYAFQASNSDQGQEPPPSQFPLNTEQLDRLYKLLESPTPSCSIATKGNSVFLSVSPSHTWILDSGASDHMTDESNMFSSYSPCAGKMIGSAKESRGLYYLDIGSASQLPSKTISSCFESFSVLNNKDDNIMQIINFLRLCNLLLKKTFVPMLVLLLKPITFLVATLWSLLTRLIFNTIAYTIVLLIQGLKSSGEGSLGIFQQVAEIIRAFFEFILQLLIGSISSIVSLVFDAVKDVITGSVSATGSMAAELAEKLKTSFEESLKQVPELFEEVVHMMSNMVTDLWNNYKEAVGYVAGNA